jgi:signal peptidase II
MKKNNTKQLLILTGIILLLTSIDIIVKHLAQIKKLPLIETSFFGITYTINTGSSFSLFSDISYYSHIISLFSIIVLLWLSYLIYKEQKEILYDNVKYIAIIFFISGILGNLYDRIVFGGVRDFLHLKGYFIFNIADIYLNIGVVLFFISEILVKRNIKKQQT